LQIDFQDLDLSSKCKLHHPDSNDLQNFEVTIVPESGLWKDAKYTFVFKVPDDYPHVAPKVTLKEKIYHPNIDTDGAVCLNLLREDWKPILTIQQIIHGLMFLFLEPNANDPLNREAAKVFRENYDLFKRKVAESLGRGRSSGSYRKYRGY
jgi:ubiquitin-protein ligase